MVRRKPKDPKETSLHEQGTLNPKPDSVTDPLFDTDQFFDRRDLLQVKYEMLRRVQVEGESISHSAANFGLSRPAFYDAQAAFEARGLAGLVPKKRGPHGPHKLTEEVMDFVEETLREQEGITPEELIKKIKKRFGIDVHPRTLDKALRRRKKKQQ
jgi:transposase